MKKTWRDIYLEDPTYFYNKKSFSQRLHMRNWQLECGRKLSSLFEFEKTCKGFQFERASKL